MMSSIKASLNKRSSGEVISKDSCITEYDKGCYTDLELDRCTVVPRGIFEVFEKGMINSILNEKKIKYNILSI